MSVMLDPSKLRYDSPVRGESEATPASVMLLHSDSRRFDSPVIVERRARHGSARLLQADKASFDRLVKSVRCRRPAPVMFGQSGISSDVNPVRYARDATPSSARARCACIYMVAVVVVVVVVERQCFATWLSAVAEVVVASGTVIPTNCEGDSDR